jgi:hypothetical protein
MISFIMPTIKFFDEREQSESEALNLFDKFYIDLSYNLEQSVTVSGSVETEEKLLGFVYTGTPKVGVKWGLFFKSDAEGSLTFSVGFPVFQKIEMQVGRKAKNYFSAGSSPFGGIEAEAKAGIRASLAAKVSFVGGTIEVAEIGLYSGIEVNASRRLWIDPICFDMNAYVPASFAAKIQLKIGTLKSGSIDLFNIPIWTSENSKFKWNWHVENKIRVDECSKTDCVHIAVIDADTGDPISWRKRVAAHVSRRHVHT